MTRKRVTLACGIYDRTRPLAEGVLRPEGLDLIWIHLEPYQIFYRMLKNLEFEVCEMSLSNYLTELCKPEPRFVAIPAFVSRVFRHGNMFVNTQSGIEKPEDLRGKRVGCPEYSMTALVWVRAILQHEYGVHPEDMTWFVGGVNAPTHVEGRFQRVEMDLPPEISITPIPENTCLNEMLLSGELDAVFGREPQGFLDGDPRVKRLFEDFGTEEKEYYRRTRFFPIMHMVVIRKDLYERYPWMARNLYDAFLEAKNQAVAKLFRSITLGVALPGAAAEAVEWRKIMGPDIWPYGVKANEHILKATARFVKEQHLVDREISIEEMFAAETLDT